MQLMWIKKTQQRNRKLVQLLYELPLYKSKHLREFSFQVFRHILCLLVRRQKLVIRNRKRTYHPRATLTFSISAVLTTTHEWQLWHPIRGYIWQTWTNHIAVCPRRLSDWPRDATSHQSHIRHTIRHRGLFCVTFLLSPASAHARV